MQPATRIIDLFGGDDAVAKIIGRHPVTVRKWTYPRACGGTDGTIPNGPAQRLLAHAKSHGIGVTPADFFPDSRDAPGFGGRRECA
jgi:DNA-binding transcriptional MocR family regulator